MHKAERLGWEQTSREWLQDRIRAAIPHATTAEELLAYLEAGDILVKPRRGPSGDLLGYAVAAPVTSTSTASRSSTPAERSPPTCPCPN
jgi:hypothetical protein